MEQDETLMEGIDLFMQGLGQDAPLGLLFGPSGPDLQNMFDKLLFEVKQVFLTDLSDQAVYTATGVAQATVDFFSIQYANAVAAGASKPQLYKLLTQGDIPQVENLGAQAATMLAWANDNPKAIAQKTCALALTIYGLIVLIFRERAANNPDPVAAAAEVNDMRDYAARGVARIQPLFTAVRDARWGGISGINSGWDVGFNPILWVTDSWMADFGSDAPPILAAGVGSDVYGPSPPADVQIGAALTAYLALLHSGSDEDASALTQALGDAFYGDGPEGNQTAPTAQDVIAQIPSFQTTGRWLAQAPSALQNLQTVAGAVTSAP